MYSEKLKNLGARALNDDSPDQCTFAQVQSELGVRFTDEYMSLLNYYSGSIVFDNGAIFKPKQKSPVDTDEGFQSLEMLYGLKGDSNLLKRNKMYKDQIPSGFIAIGESIGGSQICISRDEGEIFFWFHEAQSDDVSLFRISDNLDEFLSSLETDDMQTQGKREVDEFGSFLDF